MPPVISKAYKARSELMFALKTIRPGLAEEIEKSDALDHSELNRREEQLSRELVFLNRDCDRLLVNYDRTLSQPNDSASEAQSLNELDPRPNSAGTIADLVHNHIEEKLAKALLRRQEITAELQKIKEQRDTPLFVRMNVASELLKSGLDKYAAEVLLDLITSGFYGLEQLMSGDSDTVEFCLRRVSTIHGTTWLDRLIYTQPPAVANYMRLRELIKDSVC